MTDRLSELPTGDVEAFRAGSAGNVARPRPATTGCRWRNGAVVPNAAAVLCVGALANADQATIPKGEADVPD
jgi:hypothetical protein